MPKQIFGAESVVTTLNRAFTDTSPSNATFNNQVATAGTTTDSQMAFAKQYGAGFAGQTADALSTLILGNLGVLPNAALQTALKDYITAAGVANIGIIALQLGDILSGLENATGDQAGFKAAAVAWNAEVTAAYNYSSNTANTSPSEPGPVVTPGTTFTMTTGSDIISPTSADATKKSTTGNDTFRADITAAGGDLGTADSVDGGAGTDTLNALLNGTAAKPVLSNVEIINVTTITGDATLDLGDSTGVQQAWFKGAASTKALTINDAALTTTIGLTGTYAAGAATTVVFKNAAGTNDTATLAIQEAVAADKVTVAAVENLNLVVSDIASTTGNDSTLSALVAVNTKNIVVTGTVGTLTVGGANTNLAALKTFDASGLKGNLSLNLDAGTDPTTGVTVLVSGTGTNTVKLGAGSPDVIKFVAGNVSTVNKMTTVTAFDFAADKLDVAAFTLGADTTVGSTAVAVAGDIAGFFSGTGRVVLNAATETVYVDINKDGNFSAGTDLAIKLTGATAANFTAADLTLA